MAMARSASTTTNFTMQIVLDEAVLRNQAVRGIHPVTKEGNSHIRKKLRGKRGRRGAQI